MQLPYLKDEAMASKDFLPSSDEALRGFTLNFNDILAAQPAKYGLSDEQMSDYTEQQAAFTAALAAATSPMTRGNRTVYEKNEAKRTLVATTRSYARQINGLMRITDDERQALGLNIRDTTPTRINPPTTAPYVRVTGVENSTIYLELRQDGDLRAKPANVADALVFTYVGTSAPTDVNQWNYAMTTGRTNLSMPFPAGAGGNTLWIAAFWTNAKGQSGPSSSPVSVNLPATSAGPEQINQQPTLKMAA